MLNRVFNVVSIRLVSSASLLDCSRPPVVRRPGFPNPLSCSEEGTAKTLSTKPATPNFTQANDEEDEEDDGCGGAPHTHPSHRLLPW